MNTQSPYWKPLACLQLIVLATFLSSSTLVLAQDDCCGHTTDWHQHARDGYIFSYWKREHYKQHVFWDEQERTITNEWKDLFSDQFSNASCTESRIEVEVTRTFDHSVTINWGGEISASAEGAARLWFWKCKASVGAKVDWHRSGTATETETFNIKQIKGLARCRYIEFFYELREVHKAETAKYAKAEFRCRDHHTNELSVLKVCGYRDISIEGRGYINTRSGWKNELKICNCTSDDIVTDLVDFNDDGTPNLDDNSNGNNSSNDGQ